MADQPITAPAGPIYGEVAPRRYWPVATFILIALNFLLYGLEINAGGPNNLAVLLNLGAAYGPYMRRGEYWRLVMPMFLHGGWLHILGNTYCLYILGPILERVYGYGRYTVIYVTAGMGGAYLSMTVSRNVSVGASGAIMGIAGAILVTGYAHRDAVPRRWGRAFGAGMIPFIVLNLLFGLSMHGIDNWGHIGGLASGALLALLIPPPRHVLQHGEVAEPPSQAMVAFPLVVVIFSMAATARHYRTIQAMDRLLAEGERFGSAHQYERQFQSFQQARNLAPREEGPHEEMGEYYLTQKHYDQAIQEFQQAIRLTEGDDQPRLELGVAWQLKGDQRQSQQMFEDVLGQRSQKSDTQRLVTDELALAELYTKLDLYGEVIKAYQQALILAPGLAVAHNNLAWLYATCDDPKFRDPKAALDHALTAVKLTQGRDAGFIDTLSEAFFANREFDLAVETQKKALAIEPNNQELQEHMARYRKAAGI